MRADLALVGFGHVGRRFVRLLEEQRQALLREHDLQCRIVAIATRRHGAAFSDSGLDGLEAAARVEAGGMLDGLPGSTSVGREEAVARLGRSGSALPVVVETTTLDVRAGEPAISHVRSAIAAGCHVITANKGPAAFAYHGLHERARAAGVAFLFEGAVMDGVPVFNLVRKTMPGVRVLGFRGVVNNTTNAILSALEDGEPFGPALARMQAAGIAEADPSLDLDGWDAAAKASVLANVLLDGRVTPHDVERMGIDEATGEQARAAVKQGRRLRLVASGRRGAKPAVRPEELEAGDLLAGLKGTANALILETDLLGEVAICQLGGGLTQTAYALLSDLLAIRRLRPAADRLVP